MTTIKVINDTDVGTTLDISTGKLEAASSMATDAEVAAAITAQDAAENAAEAIAALRANFLRRAQQVLTSEAIWEVTPTAVKFSVDPSNGIPRIMVMGAGEGANSLNTGYLEINPPAAGTVVKGLGTADTVVDANGYIPLSGHDCLYYKIPAADSFPSTAGEWMRTSYAEADYDIPPECVFIAQSMFNGAGGRKVQLFDGRILTQGLNYQDTNWIDLAPYFTAGVSAYASGFQTPRFRRLNNRVYLEGLLNTPSATYTGALATLPAGFQPSLAHLFTCLGVNSSVRLDVYTDGMLLQQAPNGGWVSLDGINFGLD